MAGMARTLTDHSAPTADVAAPRAVLYRMALATHLCPSGLKARWLLRRHDIEVDDRLLTTREQVEAFKADAGVATTPQIYLDGVAVGGYDALRERLTGHAGVPGRSYRPVLVIFAMAAMLALAITGTLGPALVSLRSLELFAAFSMTLLAVQKLRDVEAFSSSFLAYDLLARRWVGYAYLYPYGEALAGVLMVAGGIFGALAAPLALLIGSVGAVSVFKAVYLEGRDLTCACAGGNTNVPLGPVSLLENLVMMVMGLWMLVQVGI